MSEDIKEIEIPDKIIDTFEYEKSYYIFYGGRGGGKSESIARILLIEGMQSPVKILCCREFQSNIRDSVHSLLEYLINLYDMGHFYTVLTNEIWGANGTQFIFKGLKKEAVGGLKSIPNINICWVEEAQHISRKSLDILLPTVRSEGSKIIFSMNPEHENDPVYEEFVLKNRKDTIKCKINYYDNPFISKTLLNQMEEMKATNYEKYLHIWEGELIQHSDALVFKDRFVVDTIPRAYLVDSDEFLFGADWGVKDPTTLIKMIIKQNRLYIVDEVYETDLNIELIPQKFLTILDPKYTIIADNARPETINYCNNHGLRVKSCKKWAGSVVEGVEFMKSFKKIIISPDCKNTIREFSTYSYKIHKQTGDILDEIEDNNNHAIDAIRYALEPFITQKIGGGAIKSEFVDDSIKI